MKKGGGGQGLQFGITITLVIALYERAHEPI